MKRIVGAVVVLAIGGYLLWPFAFTVVPVDDESAQVGAFDPVAYVDGVWERVNTTIRDDAVDLAVVLAAIEPNADGRVQKDDLTKVVEQYGLVTAGEAHVYMVRATGKVTAVDTTTSLGSIEVAVDGYDGPISVHAYVGPRIPSDESSVRDAVGFISFGDFREQTEYGKVAAEINKRVSQALSTLDREHLLGARVTLVGAMTIRTFNLVEIDVHLVNVVPVAIDVS